MKLYSFLLVLCLISSMTAYLPVPQAAASPIALSPTWSVNSYNNPAPNGVHVTLSGESSTGYTYSGSGTSGLPGTVSPDSRRRPKVYQNFASFNAAGVGSTLSMSYDILWGGVANPDNESQDWRFGFISSTANGGKGVSLGANFDLGNLAGTVAYEFYTDPAVTTGLGTPASGTMDSAFTETLNDLVGGDLDARISPSNVDPFNDDVSFNDRTDRHRVVLTFERIVNGYNLSFAWTNLVSGNTLTHSAAITTSDSDPSVALAAGVTSWDRLGFFVNDDSLTPSNGPWTYTMSNVQVTGVAVPEPATVCLMVFGMFCASIRRIPT